MYRPRVGVPSRWPSVSLHVLGGNSYNFGFSLLIAQELWLRYMSVSKYFTGRSDQSDKERL